MQDICRLCASPAPLAFTKTQLKKHLVRYFRCTECEALQTEAPYWIDEAYQNLNFARDTGMVARTLATGRLILALALDQRLDRNDRLLDFGGGTGLLTRYLRDYGLNGFWCDKYAQNIFALGFESTLAPAKLITAFEVFEHLPQPRQEIAALLAQQPDFLLISTKLYQGQDISWWYLLEDGQHVQFYSKKGLETLAQTHHYHLNTDGSTFHLFSKKKLPTRYLKHLCKKSQSLKIETRARSRWASRTEEDHRA